MARRRKKSSAAVAVQLPEAQFERELEVFRTEAESASQYFYAYLAIHASAGSDKAVLRLIKTAPLFWNTMLGGLQTAAFVALGRIFDNDSAHNLGRLMRLVKDNPQIFSKAALALRKQGTGSSPPSWLSDYMKSVYVTKASNFRRLRDYVSKHRKIYLAKYQPLRHQVFAHKGVSSPADVSALFAQTNIREMQRMLVFLRALYEALWQLFVNGKRPTLRPQKYAVGRMLDRHGKGGARGVHERLVHEAHGFMKAACK